MDDKALETLVNIIKDDVSKPIEELATETRSNFEGVFGRLETVEQELTAQGSSIKRLETDVSELKEDVSVLKEDVQELKDTTNRIEGRLSGVEKKAA